MSSECTVFLCLSTLQGPDLSLSGSFRRIVFAVSKRKRWGNVSLQTAGLILLNGKGWILQAQCPSSETQPVACMGMRCPCGTLGTWRARTVVMVYNTRFTFVFTSVRPIIFSLSSTFKCIQYSVLTLFITSSSSLAQLDINLLYLSGGTAWNYISWTLSC